MNHGPPLRPVFPAAGDMVKARRRDGNLLCSGGCVTVLLRSLPASGNCAESLRHHRLINGDRFIGWRLLWTEIFQLVTAIRVRCKELPVVLVATGFSIHDRQLSPGPCGRHVKKSSFFRILKLSFFSRQIIPSGRSRKQGRAPSTSFRPIYDKVPLRLAS